MSAIGDLASSVRQLASAAESLETNLSGPAPQIQQFAGSLAARARYSDAPGQLQAAAASLDAAARALTNAADQCAQTRMTALSYSAWLAAGSGGGGVPIDDATVAARTTTNRIDLADNAHRETESVPDFGGYLDVVMHGDAQGTQADIAGTRIDFTLDEVESLVRTSGSWGHRPIRLMSCSTGQRSYAQELANRLGVVVYAPTDTLSVGGGTKQVQGGGTWRRFEPS